MARPDNPSSIYLDSNALICAMTKQAGYEPVAEVMHLADTGKLEVTISDLSYVEVRGWGKADPYPAELDARCLTALDNPT